MLTKKISELAPGAPSREAEIPVNINGVTYKLAVADVLRLATPDDSGSASASHLHTAASIGAIPAVAGAATLFVGVATTEAAGISELATNIEALAGTDPNRVLSAAALAYVLSNRATCKAGLFTRDMSFGDGSQLVTGVGFRPNAVLIVANKNGTPQASWGVSDGIGNYCVCDYNGAIQNAYAYAGAYSIFAAADASNWQRGAVSSFGGDGFTIAWTKTGAPSGMLTCVYLAMR